MRLAPARQRIYERDAGICGFCGQHVPWEQLQLDHRVSAAEGGRATFANLRVSHRTCNLRAGAELRTRRGRERRGRLAGSQRFILVLPDVIAAQIREIAERERRTLNAQIELLIERGLRQDVAAA